MTLIHFFSKILATLIIYSLATVSQCEHAQTKTMRNINFMLQTRKKYHEIQRKGRRKESKEGVKQVNR